jgi:hypothetical protein
VSQHLLGVGAEAVAPSAWRLLPDAGADTPVVGARGYAKRRHERMTPPFMVRSWAPSLNRSLLCLRRGSDSYGSMEILDNL